MRINEIRISGLFGIFNHVIPLNHSEPITIIHGPNGFGKTVMLKMIAAFIEGQTGIFKRVPFKEFKVFFDNGTISIIPRHESKNEKDSEQGTTLEVTVNDKTGAHSKSHKESFVTDVPRKVLDTLDRHIPGPYSRSGSGWRDSSGQFYSLDEILTRFPENKELVPKKYRINAFSEIVEGLGVFFVETKRLDAEKSLRRTTGPTRYHLLDEMSGVVEFEESVRPRLGLRVDQYSQDIVQRIKSALADYAKHSQESDRTFPERLVRFVRDREKALPEKQLLAQMIELESKRQRLISLGFLDSESGLRDLTEEDVNRAPEALTIYVSDVQQKLAVFDDLSQRVGKLIDVVNERFKYKSLTLNRDEGFRLRTHSGEPVSLEDLSSGEQHELVVLYELLFRAPRNGLVLVDEPEISLHVAWQSRFLQDLTGILELTKSYGIVATHSPVIIGTRWDLTQALTGPEEAPSELRK